MVALCARQRLAANLIGSYNLRMSFPQEPDDSIDYAPFIGVILLLFLFFVAASSFMEEARGIAVDLPTAESTQAISRDAADTITYSANEELSLQTSTGEETIGSLAELESNLKARSDTKRPVILRVDRRCTYEQYLLLKNAVLNAGVTSIFEETTFSK